jgi:hypothetical protein
VTLVDKYAFGPAVQTSECRIELGLDLADCVRK